MKQSPESKYCSKPGIVSRMRSINCPDAGLYFMVTSTEFKSWRVVLHRNFKGEGTEQRQHLVYIHKHCSKLESKYWNLKNLMSLILHTILCGCFYQEDILRYLIFFLEFYSCCLSIPPRARFWPAVAVSDNYFVVLWREQRWMGDGQSKKGPSDASQGYWKTRILMWGHYMRSLYSWEKTKSMRKGF